MVTRPLSRLLRLAALGMYLFQCRRIFGYQLLGTNTNARRMKIEAELTAEVNTFSAVLRKNNFVKDLRACVFMYP